MITGKVQLTNWRTSNKGETLQLQVDKEDQLLRSCTPNCFRDILTRRNRAKNGFFLPQLHVPAHTASIEKMCRRVVKDAGPDKKEVVRHTLSHTAITPLVQAGVDLPAVQRIAGRKPLERQKGAKNKLIH